MSGFSLRPQRLRALTEEGSAVEGLDEPVFRFKSQIFDLKFAFRHPGIVETYR